MFESPVLQELKAEWTREAEIEATRRTTRRAIALFLAARFGVEAAELEGALSSVDDDLLGDLVAFAATCPDLESFRERISR